MSAMIPTAVTTFSTEYYERWGREGLSSMVKFWPGKIVAYYERDKPPDFAARVEYRDLFAQPDLVNFVAWTSMVPLAQGILPNGNGYHYNFNANKFGRKVYAITDYAKEGVPFCFLGADTRCVKPVTVEFLNGLFDGYPGVFLLRRHLNWHVESDFAGYDPRDKKMAELLVAYRECFNNGAFLELKGWHDCIALDRLLDLMKLTDKVNNLSANCTGDVLRGPHVWPQTVLAEYIVHLKGKNRKNEAAA